MRSVLVTGGSGFVGSHVIESLLGDSNIERIHSIDNNFCSKRENEFVDPRLTYQYADTRDLNTNRFVASLDVDTVFHLGEYARIVSSFDDIRLCHEFNRCGTFEVLEFCRDRGAKLIYAASSSKFGNGGRDEDLSPYAWMKSKNVELIKNYGEWFGLPHAVTYFFNVYGPRQRSVGGYATVIGIFEQCVLAGKPIPVVAPGTQSRVFTHVQDIARGMILAAVSGSGDGYLLGADKEYTILEVAELFHHPYEIVPERRGERLASVRPDLHKQEELGWRAEIDLGDYVGGWLRGVGKG